MDKLRKHRTNVQSLINLPVISGNVTSISRDNTQ